VEKPDRVSKERRKKVECEVRHLLIKVNLPSEETFEILAFKNQRKHG
jgi:hypothetical protein